MDRLEKVWYQITSLEKERKKWEKKDEIESGNRIHISFDSFATLCYGTLPFNTGGEIPVIVITQLRYCQPAQLRSVVSVYEIRCHKLALDDMT